MLRFTFSTMQKTWLKVQLTHTQQPQMSSLLQSAAAQHGQAKILQRPHLQQELQALLKEANTRMSGSSRFIL